MLNTITIISIGFSVTSSLILFSVYTFFLNNVNKSWFAVSSCAGLLICLSGLQLGHLQYLLNASDPLAISSYRWMLFLVPVFFFFFSRSILLPDVKVSPWLMLHFCPVFLNIWVRPEISVPLLFLLGLAYSYWLAIKIIGMRQQRKRFKVEIFFFGLFSITAVFILVIGISLPYIGKSYFYYSYANSIALSFVLIVAALMAFPELLSELAEATRLSYSASTLKGVDIPSSVSKLEGLMKDAKLYENQDLNMGMVAYAMRMSPHQLSELVNTQFGMSFSHYIRAQRIAAAKTLLAKEPEASILAISLETGFKTQSNFYAAFKEITGLSPGSYRKSLQ